MRAYCLATEAATLARMFRSVLIANRGEVAARIARTLRRLGVPSVAAASVPDRRGLAARTADRVEVLEGYSAAETYLDVRGVLDAADRAGCDAIHPGYGFLSEDGAFAEACAARGVTFIGPAPDTLRALGDKSAARRLAASVGVPTVPGWDGDDDDATLVREAAHLGLPLLVKARGGGGGRGMREVRNPEALPEALASARREALSAFGDPGLLLERLIEGAHHVEVQVFGDTFGNLVHLGERDCSVQRRRQKLIEESPSPVVDASLRAALCQAALTIARAANYVNAGTVEFLVGEPDADGVRPFWFIEVNPRLQVEHPVTELVTGLDLVEWQLRIAAGEPLPLRQDEIVHRGHAIELRINAEDPSAAFRPSTGSIRRIAATGATRTDLGYGPGDRVPMEYDSLLGKLLVHSDDRARSLEMLALAALEVEGVATNQRLLRAVTRHPEFAAGATDTGWLERTLPELLEAAAPARSSIASAARFRWAERPARWIGAGSLALWVGDGAASHEARLHPSGSVTVAGDIVEAGAAAEWPQGVALAAPPRLPSRAKAVQTGATVITAPLAGTIAAVHVNPGDAIQAGTLVVTIEAMKMEHRVTAVADGTVKAVAVTPRDVVREGDRLVELA